MIFMSCHEIGRGVDVIMRQVLDMYDEGKISKEAALEMVKKFPKAVHWCDGNEDEAQRTLTLTHCAACLHKYEEDDEIMCVDVLDSRSYDINISEFRIIDAWYESMEKNDFNGRSLCRSCFNKFFDSLIATDDMKKLLEAYSKHEA
jgi:hypothetical protein